MNPLTIDYDIKINLYRIVQEALNNIKKHAHADHVMIRLAHDNTKPVFSIGDDGNGFDPEKRLKEMQKEKRLGFGEWKKGHDC